VENSTNIAGSALLVIMAPVVLSLSKYTHETFLFGVGEKMRGTPRQGRTSSPEAPAVPLFPHSSLDCALGKARHRLRMHQRIKIERPAYPKDLRD
jgi:hypothetical protein